MNKMWQLLALSAATLVACSQVLELMCQDKIQQRASAPDGSLEAILFSEDCNATSYETLVVLGSKRETLKAARQQGDLFAVNGSCEITLHWEGSRKLVIAGKVGRKHIIDQAIRWRDVDVGYELTEPDEDR